MLLGVPSLASATCLAEEICQKDVDVLDKKIAKNVNINRIVLKNGTVAHVTPLSYLNKVQIGVSDSWDTFQSEENRLPVFCSFPEVAHFLKD